MALRIIDKNSFTDYKKLLESGIKEFVPMLPYVKGEFNEFSRYLQYSDNATCIIDEISESVNCLYHLYTLPDDRGLLRSRVILPSSFEHRSDIVDKSISNLKQWLQTQPYTSFMVQMLEYGEVEYYPTLSMYLLPTLIKHGFTPYYRAYMRQEEDCQTPIHEESVSIPDNIKLVSYTDDLKDKVLDFYFSNDSNGYFINYTSKELVEYMETKEFRETAMFLQDSVGLGEIIAGVFSGYEQHDNKVWIDNFKVAPVAHEKNLGKYLLGKQLQLLNKIHPQKDIIVYMSREFQKPIQLFEAFNYYSFEFWVDAILENLQ